MAAWQTGPVRSAIAPQPVICFAPVPNGTTDAPERTPESSATRARPFADLLRQSRDENAAPVAPSSEPLPKPTVDEAGANAETGEPTSEAATTPASAARTRARQATSTTAKVTTKEDPAEDAAGRVRGETASATAPNDGNAPAGGTRDDTWIAQTLAGESTARGAHERADDELRQAGTRALAADAGGDALGAPAGARGSRAEARATGRVDANESRLAARAERIGDESAGPSGAPMLAAALGEASRLSDVATARPGGEARIDALAPGAASPTAELHVATAPNELALPTPIDSADFGAAFGVQVSLLAQDGVQQAELHLNPAETGPVSIHIVLEGTDARIDFGADLAATREAIERSLPELAAALRDAGLTLTGGGVSQHAGERPSPGDDGSRSTSADIRPGSAGREPVTARATRRVAAGGIDLYA
jgi:flagellar hook-length control protein FliK